MKAYQVFTGDLDKHGHQKFELDSTYLSKGMALIRCKEIIEAEEFKDEKIELTTLKNGSMHWEASGWDIITICKLEEIQIIE